MEADSSLLAFIDRLIKPLTDQLQGIDTKLDKAVALGERVSAAEGVAMDLRKNHDRFDEKLTQTQFEMAELRGRNRVIAWFLGLIGAPIIVGLALAGIIGVFNIIK